MKLKFLQDAFYQNELAHKKGEVYEISDEKGMASRWLKRKIAIEVKEDKPLTAKQLKDKEKAEKEAAEKAEKEAQEAAAAEAERLAKEEAAKADIAKPGDSEENGL